MGGRQNWGRGWGNKGQSWGKEKKDQVVTTSKPSKLLLKEGVHQFYKFVLKCKVRYTDTAVICDFLQICFYTARQLFRFPGTGSPGTQSWFSGTQSRFSGNTI